MKLVTLLAIFVFWAVAPGLAADRGELVASIAALQKKAKTVKAELDTAAQAWAQARVDDAIADPDPERLAVTPISTRKRDPAGAVADYQSVKVIYIQARTNFEDVQLAIRTAQLQLDALSKDAPK